MDSVFDVATGENWSRYMMFLDMFSSANERRKIFISAESAGLADRSTSMLRSKWWTTNVGTELAGAG
jgi:hypothetical protein